MAEESGLIVQLSDQVMRQALKQISEWWQAGCRDLRVAVNVSGAQFEAPGFPDWVFAHLDEAGLPGSCLELEITESLLMVDETAAALAVRAVRELGVHVAIDDFGTGYSSLAYLKHFPIEALKIDRSFVADLGRDSNDAAICAAIIAMGRQLGLKIVAEGVETQEQLQFLATHGCTLAQGFYIARPVEAAEMAKLLRIGTNEVPIVHVPMPRRRPSTCRWPTTKPRCCSRSPRSNGMGTFLMTRGDISLAREIKFLDALPDALVMRVKEIRE